MALPPELFTLIEGELYAWKETACHHIRQAVPFTVTLEASLPSMTSLTRATVTAVAATVIASSVILAQGSPVIPPTKGNGKQPPEYTMTYDNRIINFTMNGGDKLFEVGLTWYQDSDLHSLKTADLSLEVLDQSGKVIPTTLPAGYGFSVVGSMGGGVATLPYKISPAAGQIPTSVNVTWRGRQQHIVLNADNYLK